MKGKEFHQVWLALVILLSLGTSCTNDEEIKEKEPSQANELSSDGSSRSIEASTSGKSRVRSRDNMVELYVAEAEFEMGSLPAEVDFALALCREHDSNCSLRYFFIEQPAHTVELDEYWIDQAEVSNSQYSLCVQVGSCQETSCPDQRYNSNHPAVCITWKQSDDYCRWAGGRLPTEAEWEYAAKRLDGCRFPWGDEFDGHRLNYCDQNCELDKADDSYDDGYVQTAPVGSYPEGASWVGALDLAGNVWEWTADFYGAYPSEKQDNPAGPPSGGRRVLRGGSWHTSPDHVRTALRTYSGPNQASDHVGFRCANTHR